MREVCEVVRKHGMGLPMEQPRIVDICQPLRRHILPERCIIPTARVVQVDELSEVIDLPRNGGIVGNATVVIVVAQNFINANFGQQQRLHQGAVY